MDNIKLTIIKPNKDWILLKDGWEYNKCDGDGHIILAPRRDAFSSPMGGFFHINPKSGGSQLIPGHVKIDIGYKDIPAELIYGLWSITVGRHSYADRPYWFEQAYVHIPRNFDDPIKAEILAYAILWALIDENLNNRTNGQIGFTGTYKHLVFGPQRTTRGARALMEEFAKDLFGAIDRKEISFEDVVNVLKDNNLDTNGYRPYRAVIRENTNRLLKQIRYWDQIVVPKDTPDFILKANIEAIPLKESELDMINIPEAVEEA